MKRQKEIKSWEDGKLIAGVDEAGRGPLAGPVVACALILKPGTKIKGIKDSKLLSPKNREKLYLVIKSNALAIGIGKVSEKMIDRLNIRKATLLAMKRAILKLKSKPDLVVVDGNDCPKIKLPIFSLIGADRKVFSCACASIIAKVERDKIMVRYHKLYPEYQFAIHKGYPTKRHKELLRRYGPSPIHRLTFTPVKEVISR
ncbi:MAG: ribonuclease HII [candidate division WOR-3 bacterium]